MNGRRLDAMLADTGIQAQLQALQQHHIESYSGSVALLVSSRIWPKSWLFSPWSKLLGENLQQFIVPGLHGSIFESCHIKGLAKVIREYIRQ